MRKKFGGNTGAAVRNSDDALRLLSVFRLEPAGKTDGAAGWRKFYRVGEQIEKDLLQTQPVGHNRAGPQSARIVGQTDALFPRKLAHRREQFTQERIGAARLGMEYVFSVFKPGHDERVVDEPVQDRAGGADLAQIVADLGGIFTFERQIGKAKDSVERGAHGSFDTCEYRIEKKDGSLVWVHDEGHIVTDENGKHWFYVVIVDITPSIDTQKKLLLRNSELETTVRGLKETIERGSGTGDPEAIRARELLRQRQREEVFRIITNVEYDYVALLHADSSRIEFWNLSQKLPQKYRDRLGEPGRQYDFDDIRRFTADSWVDPADREMYLKSSPIPAVREALDRFGHCEFSLRGHTIEHPEQTMCRKIQHYYLGDDHDTILILQTDVTKTYLQQQTNVELARTEARRVRDILDYIASGVCVLVMPDETHLNIEYSNRQMPRLLRFSEDVQTPAQIGESTDGKVVSYFESAFSGVHPEDLPRVQEAFRAGFRLEQFTVPSFRLRTGTGGYIWVTVDIVLREIRPDGHVMLRAAPFLLR